MSLSTEFLVFLQHRLHQNFSIKNTSGKFHKWRHHTVCYLFSLWMHFSALFPQNFGHSSTLCVGMLKVKNFFLDTRNFFPGLDENSRPRDDDITPCWVDINIELPMRPRLLVRSCALPSCTFAASRLNIKCHYAQLQLGMLNLFIS